MVLERMVEGGVDLEEVGWVSDRWCGALWPCELLVLVTKLDALPLAVPLPCPPFYFSFLFLYSSKTSSLFLFF